MRTSARTVFMVVLFVTSMFMLVGKLLTPTPIQIFIQGEQPIPVGQILSFTYVDVSITAISAFLAGISGFYLLFSDLIGTPKVPLTVEETDTFELDVKFALRLLEGDKSKVFNEIVESGGEILQSELPVRMGFSKAKVTRILDYLEMKGLIIRKSYGMTNKVIVNRYLRRETLSKQ